MPLSKVSLTLVHYHNFVVYSVIFVAFKIYIYIVCDEMHIREDLVYDKYTGALIGFTDFGDINSHLLQLERSLE